MKYEYTGHTWRKRKQDVINALKHKKKIKLSNIKSIKFNKIKTKYGWKYHALVKK